MLAWAPYLTLLLVLGPVVAGLAWTLLPAFDHLPAIGRDGFGLAPWRELLATPGLSRSVALTLASAALAVEAIAWLQQGKMPVRALQSMPRGSWDATAAL